MAGALKLWIFLEQFPITAHAAVTGFKNKVRFARADHTETTAFSQRAKLLRIKVFDRKFTFTTITESLPQPASAEEIRHLIRLAFMANTMQTAIQLCVITALS